MKRYSLLLTIFASAMAEVRVGGWGGPGWSSTTPKPGWSTTTTGWPSTTTTGWPSTTTKGWSTTGWPSTTQGWSTTTGWPSTTTTGWPSTTTKGWSTTGWPSTTTTGWPSTTTTGWPSTTTQGWSTPGWGSSKAGWSGWSTTPGWSPPPTQGWSTTPGWAPPPTQGWSTTPGWGSNPSASIAELAAQIAAAGSGWAGENHAEDVTVFGGDGAPAELVVSSGGDSIVTQDGDITQVTQLDQLNAAALQLNNLYQGASAAETVGVLSTGLDVILGQSGWANSAGEGATGNHANLFLQTGKEADKEAKKES